MKNELDKKITLTLNEALKMIISQWSIAEINKDINNSNVNDYLYDMQECINIFVISPYFEDHFLIAKEKERLDKIENGGAESD